MSVPTIRTTELRPGDDSDAPVVVLGPSLGTAVGPLWSAAAAHLPEAHRVVGWDLPGHGASPAPDGAVTVAELAAGVLAAVDATVGPDAPLLYAGVSVGGAVGLQLLLDAPERFVAAALLCTGARIGTADAWAERAATVKAFGTSTMEEGSRQRWFAPGFAEREPATAAALLDGLARVEPAGYAATCSALARFDVRARLGEISVPVLAVAGADDQPTPPTSLAEVADGVRSGQLVVLDQVGHLAPAEAPRAVADLVAELASTHGAHRTGVRDTATVAEQRAAGMAVRRQVLGDAHVDRATAAATGFTSGFQDFITQYAWGGIWTRPGLDRRSRSLVTLTALVARGHHEELAMHVRAAVGNGVTVAELEELFLQTAIYCGVPDANTAFRIAQATLREMGVDLD